MGKFSVENNIDESKKKIGSVRDELQDTYKIMREFKGKLASMKWKGEHKDHFELLLEMALQYHEKLGESGTEIESCLNSLSNNVSDYNDLSSVVKLKGIE